MTECWVCLRITPAQVLRAAHKIWKDRKWARAIGEVAAETIRKCYERDKVFLCGRSLKGTLGGLFYILGRESDQIVSQEHIASALGSSGVTVRESYRRWLQRFPEWFPVMVKECAIYG